MKFWIVEPNSKQAVGPIEAGDLPRLHFFGPESLVAADGSRDSKDWTPAKNVDALKVHFSRPASSPPPLPLQQVPAPHETPKPRTRARVFLSCAVLLTTLNVPWQFWLFFVMGREDAHLDETFWLFALMAMIPTLLTLSLSLEGRRRSIRENTKSGSGALSIIFVTINGLLTLVLSLWLCLVHAVHRSGP